jgi:DNA-binding MarR family transcriptional regulator
MTDHDDLKLSDYQALAEFRYQLRCFLRFSEKAAREAGLEPQHHQLMLAIKGSPDVGGPRIAYLAERLQIQHHSAVELVDRLAHKGLVARSQGGKDRREVYVCLTARGERVLRELTQHMRTELCSAGPALVVALRKLIGSEKLPNRAQPRRGSSRSGKDR